MKYSRYRINTLYTLHLHNVVCQLCLNRAGGGKKISILFAPDFELRNSGKAQLCSPVSPCDPHWGPYTAALSWWPAGAGGFKMSRLSAWQLPMAACWEFSGGCQQGKWLYLSSTWLLGLSHSILAPTERKGVPRAWEGKLLSP